MNYTHLFKNSLIATVLCASFSVSANTDSNSGRWYQVEMIVLKNNAIKSANPEYFDISVLPSKPDTVETLTESQAKPVSFLDLDFALLSQPDLDLQALINDEMFTYDQVIRFFSNTQDTQDLVPKPFSLLNESTVTLSLKEHADNFKRNKDMEVVEYLAWQQPIYDSQVYTPIELNFGEQYSGQYEISGWLHLTISRYIHVNPQLYINEFTQINQQEFADLSFGLNKSFNTNSSKPSFQKEQPYRITSSIEVLETQQTASKQILYIDHPELSFVFYFTPLDFTSD